MPIVTEESQPKRRRGHGWVLALALVALLPVGLFAWSWYEPVAVQVGSHRLVSGAMYGNVSSRAPGWHWFPNSWQVIVELPERSGLYRVLWLKPRESNGPTTP
jgi:hypothetical protein